MHLLQLLVLIKTYNYRLLPPILRAVQLLMVSPFFQVVGDCTCVWRIDGNCGAGDCVVHKHAIIVVAANELVNIKVGHGDVLTRNYKIYHLCIMAAGQA